MLLYLTSDENIGLFDFLTDENNILIKKFSGEFYLKKFVVQDMRNLDYYSYVVIDLSTIKDELEDITEAIIAFKAMYNPRIIIFAEEAEKSVLDKIIEETETYNIITAGTIEKIKEEMQVCISPQGMSREYILKAVNSKFGIEIETFSKYSFEKRDVKIVAAGAMNRVGTTTTAMNMANFLAKSGAKVSYTEANNSNHLLQVHSYFFTNIPINDKHFSYKGVDYFLNGSVPIDADYNFNIIDIGVLNEIKLKVFQIANVKILCGGTKPYEIPELVKSLKLIDNIDLDIVLQIVPENERQNIRKILSINQDKIHFNNISMNLFDSNINSEVWESILSDYIVEHKTL